MVNRGGNRDDEGRESLAGEGPDDRPYQEETQAQGLSLCRGRDRVTASPRTMARTCGRVLPTARRSPNSRVRSSEGTRRMLSLGRLPRSRRPRRVATRVIQMNLRG